MTRLSSPLLHTIPLRPRSVLRIQIFIKAAGRIHGTWDSLMKPPPNSTKVVSLVNPKCSGHQIANKQRYSGFTSVTGRLHPNKLTIPGMTRRWPHPQSWTTSFRAASDALRMRLLQTLLAHRSPKFRCPACRSLPDSQSANGRAQAGINGGRLQTAFGFDRAQTLNLLFMTADHNVPTMARPGFPETSHHTRRQSVARPTVVAWGPTTRII